ncbi:hypothetical protein GEMRC1_005603 [Eukaryota sp. GEM-RC1]
MSQESSFDHESWSSFLQNTKSQLKVSCSPSQYTYSSPPHSPKVLEPTSPPSPLTPLRSQNPRYSSTISKDAILQNVVNSVISKVSPYRSPSPQRVKIASRPIPKKQQTVQEALTTAHDLGITVLGDIRPRRSKKYSPSTPLPSFKTRSPTRSKTPTCPTFSTPLENRPQQITPRSASKDAAKRIAAVKAAKREKERQVYWRVVNEAKELRKYDRRLVTECNVFCAEHDILKYFEIIEPEDILEETVVNQKTSFDGEVVRVLSVDAFRREFRSMKSMFDLDFKEPKEILNFSKEDVVDDQDKFLKETRNLIEVLQKQLQLMESHGGFCF